jgi:hypothetical protein
MFINGRSLIDVRLQQLKCTGINTWSVHTIIYLFCIFVCVYLFIFVFIYLLACLLTLGVWGDHFTNMSSVHWSLK